MDPGVRSNGMKADPLGYLWSKYECFLMSSWWDILHSNCLNIKLWSNSTNGTKYERTNKWTNEHMYGRQKDENYISLGINAGGIKSRELYIKSRDSRAFPWKNFFIHTFYIQGCLFYFFNFILDKNLCKQTVMLRSVESLLLGLHFAYFPFMVRYAQAG